jgi:PAS domain S-box-containing protein
MAKILVVEDESVVAWHIQETLQKLGHEVIRIATTGKEAILITAQTKPHLVLMDISLQGDVDGVTAAKNIYFELDVPVVYLTAHADEQTLQRATETSPFGYLVKPFQEAELHATIKIALQRHQLEKALKETQQWYATTLISIGDATIATDIDGFVTFMNPTAEILTGWNQEQALGAFITQILDLVDGETRDPIENPLLAAMCRGDTMTLPEGSLLRARDGTEHEIGDSASPIRNRDGQIIGGVMVFQDLSDRRRVEASLQQQNQWLERSQDQLMLQLHQRNEQLQQAVSCTQLLQRILEQTCETPDRLQILQLTLKELGQTLEADYCWATLHDEAYEIATIVCDHRGQGVEAPTSLVGNQIELQDFSRFYLRLFQRNCWVDPSSDLLPLIYQSLLNSSTQMLICPIADERRVIGEVGILIQGKPVWSRLQAELAAQVVSQATIVLRQTQLDQVTQTQVGES